MKLYSLNITCINRFNYNIYRIVTIGNIPIGWSICGTNNITGTIYFTNIPIYWHTVFIISLLKYFYITESGNIFLTFESAFDFFFGFRFCFPATGRRSFSSSLREVFRRKPPLLLRFLPPTLPRMSPCSVGSSFPLRQRRGRKGTV